MESSTSDASGFYAAPKRMHSRRSIVASMAMDEPEGDTNNAPPPSYSFDESPNSGQQEHPWLQENDAQQTSQKDESMSWAAEEARRHDEQEAIARAAEDAKRKQDAEEKARAEAEARRMAEEEIKHQAAEESRRRAEEEAERHAQEEARQRAEDETRRRKEEELAKHRAQEEASHRAEEESRKRAEEESRKKAAEEENRRQQREKQPESHPREPTTTSYEWDNVIASQDSHTHSHASSPREHRSDYATPPKDGSLQPHPPTHARGEVTTQRLRKQLGPVEARSKIQTKDEIVEQLEVELKQRRIKQQAIQEERERRYMMLQKLQEEQQEQALAEQRHRYEEERRIRAERIESRRQRQAENERQRLERVQRLKIDPEVVAGRKRVQQVIDERKQKLESEEQYLREAALKERHEKFVMGDPFYEHLRQHEQKVVELSEAQQKRNEQLKEVYVPTPKPPHYNNRAHRRVLAEEKRQKEEANANQDRVRTKRNKQMEYAGNVRSTMMPTNLVPFEPEEEVHTQPRDALTLGERYQLGNKNLHEGAQCTTPSQQPHEADPAEEAKEHDEQQRKLGHEYLKHAREYITSHPKPKQKSKSVVEQQVRVAAKEAVEAVERAHVAADAERSARRHRQAATNREMQLQKRRSTVRRHASIRASPTRRDTVAADSPTA